MSGDQNREESFIQEPATCHSRPQWIFRGVDPLAGARLENSVVQVSVVGKHWKQLLAANVLVLFQKYEGRDGGDEEYTFLQYMECTLHLDETNETFG